MRRQRLFVFFILTAFCSFSAVSEPDSYSVRKVHQQIINELYPAQKSSGENPVSRFLYDVIISIIDFLSRISTYLYIPLLIGFVLLVGYIGMRLYSRFHSISRRKQEKNKADVAGDARDIGEDYLRCTKEAFEYAQNRRYSEAVVLLHRGSVQYLKMKNIVCTGEYRTNTEIMNDLKEQRNYEEPFSSLAHAAEQVTFGKTEVSEELFGELSRVYKKNFNDRKN